MIMFPLNQELLNPSLCHEKKISAKIILIEKNNNNNKKVTI